MGVKISNLPAIVTPALTDVFPVVQSGVTYKETVTQLSALLGTVQVTSITGTANQVIASSSTGAVTLSLPQSIASTSDVTFGNVTFSPTTKGIVGTPTNNNASSGIVGEFLSATAGPIALVSGVSNNVTSLSITAGDWDVYGSVLFVPAGAMTAVAASISVTSLTLGGSLNTTNFQTTFGTTNQSFSVPYQRLSVAATTTYYLVAQSTFAAGCDVTGVMYARRAR